jgi:hypothetical protein
MSLLLPYLGVGLLLLVVLAIWTRKSSITRKDSTELSLPRKRRPGVGNDASDKDLGERIFDPRDWDFVSQETPLEIQQMFQRERAVLAISWLRDTRRRTSQVMRAHLTTSRLSENLRPATEIRLAVSYILFLILCDSLIGLIWLRGPVRTRKIVGQTLPWVERLCTAFEQLMAMVATANRRVLETSFNREKIQSLKKT